MLNQTNISQNNNKYYVIQVVEKGGSYYAYNRWGRVGKLKQK
jgi:poly [ADP-ribose] polymerase